LQESNWIGDYLSWIEEGQGEDEDEDEEDEDEDEEEEETGRRLC
jgi:hypothetical protein